MRPLRLCYVLYCDIYINIMAWEERKRKVFNWLVMSFMPTLQGDNSTAYFFCQLNTNQGHLWRENSSISMASRQVCQEFYWVTIDWKCPNPLGWCLPWAGGYRGYKKTKFTGLEEQASKEILFHGLSLSDCWLVPVLSSCPDFPSVK